MVNAIMEILNGSSFQPEYFILRGIPGMEGSHFLLSIPFCSMYIMALVGNSLLVFIVASNESLHQPMYIFLMMLAVTDILLCSSAVPKTLSIFWFNDHKISFTGCLVQIFFIHYLFLIESSVLLIMSYDRYIAICLPLTYAITLTSSFIKRIVILSMIRAFCIITPLVILLKRLPFQQSNVIAHTYCEHIAMARQASTDILINSVYGLVAAFSSTGIDLILIIISYAVIIRVVQRLPSSEARVKAFNTCMSHICVIVMFYIPAFFSFIAHRVGQGTIPPRVHILFANLYVLVPQMMNPIIYGVKTKEIRQRVFAMCCKKMIRHEWMGHWPSK